MPTMKIPKQQMRAEFMPATYNAEKRTIDLCFTTGATVFRRSWYEDYNEELVVTPEAVRMDRLNSGAPLLNSHYSVNLFGVMGVVERGWIQDGKGYCTVRFSEREDVAPFIQDVIGGIIRNVSVGYQVHTFEKIENAQQKIPTYRAVDWEPTEVSLVPVGADAGAGVRSQQDPETYEVEIFTSESAPPAVPGGHERKENSMTTPALRNGAPEPVPPEATRTAPAAPVVDVDKARSEAVEAERKRSIEIRTIVRSAKLAETRADEFINSGATVDAVRKVVMDEWVAQDQARTASAGNISVTRDAADTTRTAMETAIILRVNPSATLKPEEIEMARQFRGRSLIEMARESLEAGGLNTRSMSRLEIASAALSQRMHTTSDFPLILANVSNNRLRQSYEQAPGTYQRWATRAPNAPDFKQMAVLALGGAPSLELIAEGAEYKMGTMAETREVYSILTYGKAIVFSRQMLINDDLRAFDRVTTGFGASARRLENGLVYAQITGASVLADGVALFEASTHKNLAGAGAIAVATLGAGRTAMRQQKDLDGVTPLNIAPSFLIVPTALEQVAYQYTSSQFVPSQSSNINEFRAGGKTALETVVEPILDVSSASVWYLAADGSMVDTVEYCFLDGNEGVFLESEMDFDSDGMKMKARLDFASKVIDYRGLYRNGTP